MGAYKGVFIFLSLVSVLVIVIFSSVHYLNRVYQLANIIKSRNDILFKTKCRIDFLFRDSEGDSHFIKNMNLYIFSFGMVFTTIKEPFILKDEYVIFLYHNSNYKKEFKPVYYRGRFDSVEFANNQINVKSYLQQQPFFMPIQQYECSIFLNSADFEKIKNSNYWECNTCNC